MISVSSMNAIIHIDTSRLDNNTEKAVIFLLRNDLMQSSDSVRENFLDFGFAIPLMYGQNHSTA